MTTSDATETARALIETLVAHGVRHVVISPGSRSAPLVYALAAAEGAGWLTAHVRIDERVGAFTALGMSRFSPAAVMTTSGTAAANLHPALIEAQFSHLPLIAVTADRPHEMRGVGANQTANHTGMFGPDIPGLEIPAGAIAASITSRTSRLVAQAMGAFGPSGPVHINIGFREPLVPGVGATSSELARKPPVSTLSVGRRLEGAVDVDVSTPTVVVAGDNAGWVAADFAGEAGLPLFAEPSSGARGGPTAIGPYQRLLADEELLDRVQNVVVFGRPTLSRPVSRLLGRDAAITIITDAPGWVDVAGTATQIASRARAVGKADPAWLEQWQKSAAAIEADSSNLAAYTAREALKRGQSPIMLGASLAVRHADVYSPVGEQFTDAPVYANRGLGGIDGTISCATGIALASGEPIRILIGDLTFAHDVGALALGPGEPRAAVQIVVLNDQGGGIFAALEHGDPQYADTFDRFFATPIAMRIQSIAEAYAIPYRRLATPDGVAEAFHRPIQGQSIVEVELPPVGSRR